MANYFIDNNGNWSNKNKKQSGNNYTINSSGQWVNNTVKKTEKKSNANPFVVAGKTVGNALTNLGTGAIKAVEGTADFISDVVANPIERGLNYVYDYASKGKKVADENYKDLKEMQKRDIKRDLTKEFQDYTGFSDIKEDWEKDSLIKSNNFGGQVAQGIGGMVPSLVVGSAAGITNPELASTKGLSGADKAKTILKNVGATYKSQLPANALLGTSSYGSGVEEALQKGATMEQARRYGLANAAIEQGTEMLTGGIPGLQGKGGIDQVIDPLIDKTGGYANALLKAGYGALGEGLEESAGTYLDALAKRNILNEDIDWNQVNQEALQSGLVGAATGSILNTPSNIENFQNVKVANQQEKVANSGKSVAKETQTKTQVKEQVQPSTEQTQPILDTNQTTNNQQTQENNVIQQDNVIKAEAKESSDIKQIRNEVEEQTGKTMSKHIETSSKATDTVKDIKNMDYDTIVYDKTTNKQSKEQALRELENNDINTNIDDIHAKFRGTERLTDVDSAKITELMKQTKTLADEAIKNGNESEYQKRMEQFRTLKGDYAVALSESGQFIQYAKVIKELDPNTQVDVLKRFVEREKLRGNKKYADVKINEELVNKFKNAKTIEEQDVIMEQLKDDTARQIKVTKSDKVNEFRFLSMLGNFKTHGRNILGNIGMYSLQSFKDGVAAIGEDVYNKVSKGGLETRTKTLKPATKEVSRFVNDKVDSFLTDQSNKYKESRGMKGDLERRRKIFSDNNIIGKALNKVSNINNKALDFEDKFFSSKMTKQAMKGFLTANGIETNADIEAHPDLVAQALDYALFKGKEATFHQDSTTANAIRNFRDKLSTGSGFSKLGALAVDSTLPFVSTPANIAKTALEYTPVIGFGNINKQFQQAPNNMKANVIVDSLSKQFTGAALMAVGAYLAATGNIKGSGEGDKEDKTEASLGNASYSIKIGNSTYDLSWLSPTAIPLFEGVEVYNAFKKAKSKSGIKATDAADLIDTMFGTLNPMTDMSVLQSIERIITSVAYGGNAVKSATSTSFSSYLQQYIPTFLSQIAQARDTKQRNTNTGGNVIDKTIDQIKYKIPASTEFTAVGKWLNKNLTRKSLPEKVDIWGNTNKTASNIWQRGFEAFLSPANRKDYKVDDTTKELERLAKETDDTSMLPTQKNKKLRVNNEDYELTGKDYTNLQKTYGQTAKKNLDALVKSDAYKNANDTDKKSMVRKIYDYASYKAKENYANSKNINFDSATQTSYAMIDAFNIPYEKYVENKLSGNESGLTMIDKLNNMNLSKEQKSAIMNYYDRPYYVNKNELYKTINNSKLSNKQKELVKDKFDKNISENEIDRYKRADNIGVDYELYAKFRDFVSNEKGDSRNGGLTKKQKVFNWIENQNLTINQKQNLYNDFLDNQGVFTYYK